MVGISLFRDVVQGHAAGSQRDGLTDDDVLCNTGEVVFLADDTGLEQVVDGDFERSTSEDAVLGTRDTVAADGTNFTLGSHHVSDHQQVANVNFEAGAVESHLQFVDDGLTSSLNAEVIVDFDDVVGVGAGAVNVFQLADTRQLLPMVER